MTGLKVAGLMTVIAAMPVAAQVGEMKAAEGIVSKLGTGSTQTVLAIVCCVMGLIIYKGFNAWREDYKTQREEDKEDRAKLLEVVSDNKGVVEANTLQNEKCEMALHRVANVIEVCDNRKQK